MFSKPHSVPEIYHYDFGKKENADKWHEVFHPALQMILQQVYPTLPATEEAFNHVQTVVMHILDKICSHPPPRTVEDVEERMRKVIPVPVELFARTSAREALQRGKKEAALLLPVKRVRQLLAEVLNCNVDKEVSLYIAAVLEYFAGDLLQVAGRYVTIIRRNVISIGDVKVVMCANQYYTHVFDEEEEGSGDPGRLDSTAPTYEQAVVDLIDGERQYLDDLDLVVRVLRDEAANGRDSQELDWLYGDFTDIYELTASLLHSIEEKQVPTIGTSFEELAEAAEFDVYSRLAQNVTQRCDDCTLAVLGSRLEASAAYSYASLDFQDTVKYNLPGLLSGPLVHCKKYLDHLKVLQRLTPSETERESLQQAEGLLRPLQTELLHAIDYTKKLVQEARSAEASSRGDLSTETESEQGCSQRITQGYRNLRWRVRRWSKSFLNRGSDGRERLSP